MNAIKQEVQGSVVLRSKTGNKNRTICIRNVVKHNQYVGWGSLENCEKRNERKYEKVRNQRVFTSDSILEIAKNSDILVSTHENGVLTILSRNTKLLSENYQSEYHDFIIGDSNLAIVNLANRRTLT